MLLDFIPNDEPWMNDSKCGNDRRLHEWQKANREDQFFDEPATGTPKINDFKKNRVKRYCSDCPVREDCLAYALRNDEAGMWAGTTERERRAQKKKAQKAIEKWLQMTQGKVS